MIQFDNVTHQFPSQTQPVLSNVNLAISQGITSIIGQSGAGKSTLIRCINGLVVPSKGSVSVFGQIMDKQKPKQLQTLRQSIGMIFQQFNLLGSCTVRENILLALRLHHSDLNPFEDKLNALLELTKLTKHQHKKPGQLSGGQQQRVAIARALITQPKILLCDEPTSSLDTEATHTMMQLLHNLHLELNIPIVMVSHDLELVKQWTNNLVILDQGQVVEHQPIIKLLKKPQSTISTKWLIHNQLPPLPQTILEQCKQQTLLQLYFHGDQTLEPLLASFNTTFNLNTSILQAKIDCIQGHIIGSMTIALTRPHPPLEQLIAFLEKNDILAQQITNQSEAKIS